MSEGAGIIPKKVSLRLYLLNNSEAPDLHLQANTFTARSWYSIDSKSKESEETTKSLYSQTTPPNNTFLPISSEVRHRESTKDSNPVKICQIREGLIQQRNQMRATFIKASRIIYHAHESWNRQLEKIRNPENERFSISDHDFTSIFCLDFLLFYILIPYFLKNLNF